ncbi:MAG: class I SAM-dependent methyltransferase, partial [Nitrospirae bacterium]|nr:class I SAM-dependent methyltransferase [Nitrospirota bacterium]
MNMTNFDDYADLYDLFYRDKDYRAECSYIKALADNYAGRPVGSLLDIGCGTGGHALVWAKAGLDVTGLDRSDRMLMHAREKARKAGLNVPFLEGDVRGFDLGKKFDAITAMFAVMSYQTATEDILSALCSVRKHLDPAGLFFFDAWSGPGVLSDPPHDRVSSFLRGSMEILRTVKPVHDVSRHVVDVHYDILCIEGERIMKRVRETHPMRYFFPQEIADYASR